MASEEKSPKVSAVVGNAMYEVWLAGLGALAQAQTQGRKQFESLVQEGMAIQEKLRDMAQSQFEAGARQMIEAAQAAQDKAQNTWAEFQKATTGHLERLMSAAPAAPDMQAFMKRLQSASMNLQSLAKWPGSGEAPAAAAPAKKATKRKSAKKRAAKKAPATRAPAKKAAKKKAAKKKAAKHS
jgi:poly(hydroxyalkanoate) granule-associated protein